MTPLQARRLHVIRTNAIELRAVDRRPGIDWLVLAVWVGIGIFSLAVLILAGVYLAAVIYAVWERFR